MSDNPIRLTLEPNYSEFARAARGLLRTEELNRVLVNAINRTLEQGRTEAFRQVTSQYTIKRKDIANTVRVIKANPSQDNPSGALVFTGTRIDLIKFVVRPGAGYNQKGITVDRRRNLFVQIRKDGGGTVSNPLFVATMKSGHKGVFSRVSAANLPIAEETGPSIAQMVGNPQSAQAVQNNMDGNLTSRLDHETGRMIKR